MSGASRDAEAPFNEISETSFKRSPSVTHSTTLRKVIDSSAAADDRLPMLDVVFDRLARLLTTSLRNFTSDNVEVGIENIACLRFGDYLGRIQMPALIAVFRANEWDNHGLIVFDGPLIFSIIDVLLGGTRGTAAMRVAGRAFTTIERALVARLVQLILAELSVSFEPLSQVTFEFERLEVSPRFATIVRPANATMQARFRIDLDDRGGTVEIVLPNATLEPVRELLIQQFMGERFGRDQMWETHLAEQIRETTISLEVILDEQILDLSRIISLEVGSQLTLKSAPNCLVDIRCSGSPLFRGRVGHVKNSVAVQIESISSLELVNRLACSGEE